MLRHVLEAGATPPEIHRLDGCCVLVYGAKHYCTFGVGLNAHSVEFPGEGITNWVRSLSGASIELRSMYFVDVAYMSERIPSLIQQFMSEGVIVLADAPPVLSHRVKHMNLRTFLQNLSRRLDTGISVDASGQMHFIETFHSGVRKELQGVKYSFEGTIRRKINLD
ncbi:hypothetical protein CC53_gp004 [Rhizobium phage vB_RleS_L338C]|uniref:hypothetical protein n=1 Tax=Rhizobium phage vB_RleS_L338C TaxID=1414737 RepID=UPI0003D7B909|nr:hypothetical protein CC53_gp004 [Rhizobium phage vB_RleS_L338C]AHC30421.1 hypothetical protein L338C_004 [Rhizobium phage vB_RleS_L338C]QNH72099.1 hypothetical protein P11VFA_133 [Rhizobium phage P11VFA]